MPITGYHAFTSPIADGTNTQLVKPSDWNSGHIFTVNLSGNEISNAFSNANGVSFGTSAGAITASVATNYAASDHSHGNPTLALTNLSGTTASNSAGFTLSLSANVGGGAGDGYNILAAGTQTAGTANTVLFNNGNGITFGMSNSSIITASHNGLTTARASNDAVGLNTALTAGPLAWTVNSGGISLNAGGAAGTSSGFAGNLISGSITHNTAGINISLNHPAWLTTAAVSNHSHGNPTLALTNLTGTTASASNGLTLSLSGNAAQTTQTQPAGNIAGVGTTFAGTNVSATVALNSNGLNLALSAPTPGGGGAINVSAGTASGNLQTIQFNDANGVSFGLNGSTITASVDAGGANITYLTYQNRQLGASSSTQLTNNQIWLIPFRVAGGYVSASSGQYIQSLSGTFTSAVAATHAETMRWCIYSNNTTNSTMLDTWASGQLTWQVWNSGTSSASWAYNGTTSSSAGTGVLTQVAGVRNMIIPFGSSVPPGLYVMAFNQSTSSAGYSALLSRYGMVVDAPMPLAMGNAFGAATATSIGYVDAGTYSVTSAAFPASIGLSEIRQHSNLVPYFKMGAI